MSQPKKRKHLHHTNTPKKKEGITYSKVIPVTTIIFILFGTGIVFFAVGADIGWLLVGALIGAVCGFLFGYVIARGLSKK